MKYIIICVIFLAGAMLGISFERYMICHIMAKFYKCEEDNVAYKSKDFVDGIIYLDDYIFNKMNKYDKWLEILRYILAVICILISIINIFR